MVNEIAAVPLDWAGLGAILNPLAAGLAAPVGETPDEACGCARCDSERREKLPWPARLCGFMILCPECGNKRCPRAAFHGNDCTGSNESGQPGSNYPNFTDEERAAGRAALEALVAESESGPALPVEEQQR